MTNMPFPSDSVFFNSSLDVNVIGINVHENPSWIWKYSGPFEGVKHSAVHTIQLGPDHDHHRLPEEHPHHLPRHVHRKVTIMINLV